MQWCLGGRRYLFLGGVCVRGEGGRDHCAQCGEWVGVHKVPAGVGVVCGGVCCGASVCVEMDDRAYQLDDGTEKNVNLFQMAVVGPLDLFIFFLLFFVEIRQSVRRETATQVPTNRYRHPT